MSRHPLSVYRRRASLIDPAILPKSRMQLGGPRVSPSVAPLACNALPGLLGSDGPGVAAIMKPMGELAVGIRR